MKVEKSEKTPVKAEKKETVKEEQPAGEKEPEKEDKVENHAEKVPEVTL